MNSPPSPQQMQPLVRLIVSLSRDRTSSESMLTAPRKPPTTVRGIPARVNAVIQCSRHRWPTGRVRARATHR